MDDSYLDNSEYRINKSTNNIRNNNRMSPSMVSANHNSLNNSNSNINNNTNNNNNSKQFSLNDSPTSPINNSSNNNNNNNNTITTTTTTTSSSSSSNNNNNSIINNNQIQSSSSYNNNNNIYNQNLNSGSNNYSNSLNSSSNSIENGLSNSGNIILNSNSNSNNNNNSIQNNSTNNQKVVNALMDDDYEIPMMSGKYHTTFDTYVIKDRQCSSYADRVLFSNKYYYSYIFMIIINLILVIWLVTNLVKKNTSVPSHWMFITLDIIVNVALFIEIGLQMISQKRRYFQTLSNLFDLFVLLVSIAGLFVYFFHSPDSNNYDYEGIIIILITCIRYGFQFLRLLALIKRQQLKKNTFNSRIDFTELRETDIDFDIGSNDDF